MKIGVAIRGATEESLKNALAHSSGPVHSTSEYVHYIYPSVVFTAEDLGDGHGYYRTEDEFYRYAFGWVLRWSLGIPLDASNITADGFKWDADWQAKVEAEMKEIAGSVVITRDEAMACICAIGCMNNEGAATNFDMRLEARLREEIGVKPNEYLTPPAN